MILKTQTEQMKLNSKIKLAPGTMMASKTSLLLMKFFLYSVHHLLPSIPLCHGQGFVLGLGLVSSHPIVVLFCFFDKPGSLQGVTKVSAGLGRVRMEWQCVLAERS